MHNTNQSGAIEITRRGHTDIETASLLGVSVATVRRWRLLNTGPRFRKFGGAVRYFREDIEAFIAGAPSGGGVEAA